MALAVYLVTIGLAVFLLAQEQGEVERDITVIERLQQTDPAKRATARELCFVVKRAIEYRQMRVHVRGRALDLRLVDITCDRASAPIEPTSGLLGLLPLLDRGGGAGNKQQGQHGRP